MVFSKFLVPAAGTVVLLFLLSACNRSNGKPAGPAPSGLPVKTEIVQTKKVPEYTEYIATLEARGSAILQPEVEGQITKILVHSGEHVNAGQPLIVIDPRRQEATLNSQEASLKNKQATQEFDRVDLERKKNLYKAGVIPKQELDQAQTAYDAANADVAATEAAVRQQSVQLRYYTVSAPDNGTIGDIPVRVGDRVQTSTPLTTIDHGGPLEAYISIPAGDAGRVKVGTPVDVLVNGQVALRTKVDFISPRIDTANQLLLIKAPVPNAEGKFRNYELVHVRVVWNEKDRVVVPVTAIAHLGNMSFAFLADKTGKGYVAKQQAITTSGISGNDYVVLSGLEPGNQLITTGVQILVDGMPVQPQ
ncbi:MAG TPA: efflux RND transporter periplasmic adaptor subunit [Terriglobales bacterium]|nr:efflux RND transporter periplasmic adaptor subunit [Terriglobales bacterium]